LLRKSTSDIYAAFEIDLRGKAHLRYMNLAMEKSMSSHMLLNEHEKA
jgi:hypothetical protein